MELIADGLLLATGLAAGLYCMVLSRRLRRLGDADEGLGPQIAALDRAILETRSALSETQERLDALKSQSQSAGERLTRDLARAKRLNDELAEATSGAERTLEKLYSAEERIAPRSPSLAPAEGSGGEEADEVAVELAAEDGAEPAGSEGRAAAEPIASRAVQLPSLPKIALPGATSLLKVERMML